MKRARGALLIGATLVAMASAAACGARSTLETSAGAGGSSATTAASIGATTSTTGGNGGGVSTGGAGPADAGPDVSLEECPVAATKYIYMIFATKVLYRFDPATNALEKIGVIKCPGVAVSLAIDRHATAYVATRKGEILRVDTTTAACEKTSYVPNQGGFAELSLAFAPNAAHTETLFAADWSAAHPSKGLGEIDTDALTLKFIAPLPTGLGQPFTLTTGGDGKLFAFSILPTAPWGPGTPAPDSQLVAIDDATGTSVSSAKLWFGQWGHDLLSIGSAAFGDSVYLFADELTGNEVQLAVARYDPTAGSASQVAVLPGYGIVGVASSTCASP